MVLFVWVPLWALWGVGWPISTNFHQFANKHSLGSALIGQFWGKPNSFHSKLIQFIPNTHDNNRFKCVLSKLIERELLWTATFPLLCVCVSIMWLLIIDRLVGGVLHKLRLLVGERKPMMHSPALYSRGYMAAGYLSCETFPMENQMYGNEKVY